MPRWELPYIQIHLDAPWLQSDFHFLAAVLLSPNDSARLIKDAIADAYDFHEWLPGQMVDGPYVGELARRDTWRNEPWTTLDARLIGKSRSYRAIRPTADFLWESHLDGSLPNGFSRHVPIPWLIRGLGLTADTNNLGVFLDAKGAPTIVTGSARGGDRGMHVLVRRDPFLDLARKNDLEPIWTVIGERRATTLKKKRHPHIRVRYNGLLWFEGSTEKHVHCSNDD